MDDKTIYRFRQGADGVFRSYIVPHGSQDGRGAGDNDQRYEGFQADHFGLRQLTRLLLLRGRVLDGKLGQGPLMDDLQPAD